MKYPIRLHMLCCLVATFLVGCVGFEPTPDTTQFYVLNTREQARPLSQGKAVLVRNVSLAEYLDNSQIAQREGSNRIIYLAQHRWAGSLDRMITGVIADEINANHPGHNATMLERGREDLIVDVTVLRFDFHPGSEVALQLEYIVVDGISREILRHERLDRQQACPAHPSIEEVVNLMEILLRGAVGDMKLKSQPINETPIFP